MNHSHLRPLLLMQFIAEIDITFSPIGETDVNRVVPYVACFFDSRLPREGAGSDRKSVV